METVKQIRIPVIADLVLSPDFFYGDNTGIYFVTDDDQYGRITFENLDSVKICRGEVMPYKVDYSLGTEEPGSIRWRIRNGSRNVLIMRIVTMGNPMNSAET